MDGQMDGQTDGEGCITSCVNVAGKNNENINK